MLTCADGLYGFFIVLVRSQLDPGEWEVVVGQNLVWVGLLFQNVVWCFTGDGGKPAPAIVDEFCVISAGLFGAGLHGLEPEIGPIVDAELFIWFDGTRRRISDGFGGRVDGIRDARRVWVVK
jgi:hypothetical protein